jgi:hypothetical protein
MRLRRAAAADDERPRPHVHGAARRVRRSNKEMEAVWLEELDESVEDFVRGVRVGVGGLRARRGVRRHSGRHRALPSHARYYFT